MTRAVVWDTTGLKGLCAHHHNSKKYDPSMLAFVHAVTEMARFPCGTHLKIPLYHDCMVAGSNLGLTGFLVVVYIYTPNCKNIVHRKMKKKEKAK